jgi:hypothetical protein
MQAHWANIATMIKFEEDHSNNVYNIINSLGLIYLLRYTKFILNPILDKGIKMSIKQS